MASPWLASNPSKRWFETFVLLYSPVWIVALLVVVVPSGVYETWSEWGYLACGVLTAAPLMIVPVALPGKADRGKPLAARYWIKANLWQAAFGFVGNYFWTHYFFQLLGASYTMPSHRLNQIPLVMFLLTHAYFCLYHTLSNMLLRRTMHALSTRHRWLQLTAAGLLVFALAYATAFMETFTIAQYPYYQIEDRGRMYSVGSLFYAIYFWVSFPAFFVMDEQPRARRWTLAQAVRDALAAAMLVTILLDLWRIGIGPISDSSAPGLGQTVESLPFMGA